MKAGPMWSTWKNLLPDTGAGTWHTATSPRTRRDRPPMPDLFDDLVSAPQQSESAEPPRDRRGPAPGGQHHAQAGVLALGQSINPGIGRFVADVFTADEEGAFHGFHTLADGLQLQPARDLAGCAPSDQIVQHTGVQGGFGVHTVLLGGDGPVAELAAVASQHAADHCGVLAVQACDAPYTLAPCMREHDILAF